MRAKIGIISILGLAVLLGAAVATAGEGEHHAAPAVDDARFEFLERLAGSWVQEAGAEASHPGGFEFRVTAGGTAIEEREFTGTPMEMVTIYHMQGRELVATHFCMLGNQPRLTAAPKIVDNTLKFTCSGTPGNAASHDDHHVHGWSIRLDGQGRLLYTAELVKEGQVTESPSLVLTRAQQTASR